jgi:hypothetical protein
MESPVLFREAVAVRVMALLLGVAALSGCQSLSVNSAQLRIIHASPDAGLIDAYQNNTGLAYNLGFGTVTTYAAMQPGTYTLSAEKAGTRQVLLSSNANLQPGKQYTEIIGDIAAGLQQTILQDQNQAAPAGEISIRLVQQAGRAGNVDVYLVPKGGRMLAGAPIAVNLGFNAVSAYIHVPAGTYALSVVPTGTVLAVSTTTLMSGAQVAYESGSVRTVVILDQETLGAQRAALTPGVQAIVATDVDAGNN